MKQRNLLSIIVIAIAVLISIFSIYQFINFNSKNSSPLGVQSDKPKQLTLNPTKSEQNNLIAANTQNTEAAPAISDIETERKAYKKFIQNHPFKQKRKIILNERGRIPKQDRIDKAMEQEFLMTFDFNTGDVPKERLVLANEQIKKQFSQKAAIAGVSWQERGPNNVGGRTRAVMYDPNDATRRKVWAGGVAGGLWFNNDISSANSTWQKVNDLWSNIAIASIAFDPSNKQIFYVGTGEGFFSSSSVRGNGIWKSTNGGTTWTQLTATNNTGNFRYVNKMIVPSANLILASTTAGIQRSTNGGTNWTEVQDGDFVDIELAANGDMYAGNRSGQIFKSTNQGQTWVDLNLNSGGGRVEIATALSNSQILYAVAHGGSGDRDVEWFKKSINAGVTWTDLTIPLMLDNVNNYFTRGQGWYDLILGVKPDNANVVIVGGVDLHRSSDGGTTWTGVSQWYGGTFGGKTYPYVHADQHAIVFNDLNSNEAIFGNDGGVHYSTNVGNTSSASFAERNNGYNVTQFYATASKNIAESNYFIAGSQDNGTHRFQELSINATTEISGGDGMFCFIDQDDANIQITSYVFNTYALHNANGNFVRQLSDDQESGRFINPADYDNTANILYSAGNDNELKRVRNVTATPVNQETISLSLNNAQISAIRADAFLANRIFIGTDGGSVFRLDNANTNSPTLTDITGTINAGYIACIDIGASDNELLVTLSNYGRKSVYYSSNGGSTWTSKDETAFSLPDMPVRWGLFNPNNTKQVLLATEMGVWSTNDITASNPGWEASNQGLANTRCDMLQYRTADKLLVLATHGRGLYTSDVFAEPKARFQTNKTLGYVGSNFIFTDLSTKATTWSWNFGANANPATANTQGAHTVSYTIGGKKNIALTINGNLTETKNNLITILPNKNPEYLIANGGNFENDTDFFAEQVSDNLAFQRGNSTVSGKNGVASGSNAWVTNLAGNYSALSEARLYSPNFNLSAWGVYQLSFKTKFKTEADYDGFIVEYSTNKGDTWTQLGNATATNWYNATKTDASGSFPVGTVFFSGTISNYETKTFNISFLSGNEDVAFRFVFRSDESVEDAGVALEDFQITGTFASTFTPANEAINVAANTDLTIAFNKTIQKGSGNILIKKLADNTTFETIAVTNANVTLANQTITINPNNTMEDAKTYFVEFSEGVFKDAQNNNFPAVSGNNTWQFTTEASTSIEDDLLSKAIQIYPNPSNGLIFIESSQNTFPILNLSVLDSKGNKISQKEYKNFSGKHTLEISNISNGLYFIQIDNGKGRIVRKVVKQ